MNPRTLALAIALLVLLALAAAGALQLWQSLETDIGFHGRLALFLGAGLSLLLGVGLMSLVFWSSRRGHDERQYRGELDDPWYDPRHDAARDPGDDRPDGDRG